MGKVEYAYSLKLHKIMTASEAHEAWVMGKISDKTAFKCCSSDCSAQITCVNMDKPQWQMKMREHFKVFGDHDINCSEIMEQVGVDVEKIHGIAVDAPKIGEAISFHMERPDNHDESEITSSTNYGDGQIKKIGYKVGTEGLSKEKKKRKSNLYLLSTLVRNYLGAKKRNELNETKIQIEMSGKNYEYSLSTLFNEIVETKLINDEAWKTKVYFGKAIIKKNDSNEYWIKFNDKFINLDIIIRCSIKKEIINGSHNKSGSIRNLERFLNKEVYCFLLGTFKITDNAIYINIKSLDHISCSLEDVKNMSESIGDE